MTQLNSLQRTLLQRRQKAQARKDSRVRPVETYWERTGWFYLRWVLRSLGLKGIAKRAFTKPRVLRLMYARFRGIEGYHLWEIETMCSRVLVLVVDRDEQIERLKKLIEHNREMVVTHRF